MEIGMFVFAYHGASSGGNGSICGFQSLLTSYIEK
jgi:hypothetical protein